MARTTPAARRMRPKIMNPLPIIYTGRLPRVQGYAAPAGHEHLHAVEKIAHAFRRRGKRPHHALDHRPHQRSHAGEDGAHHGEVHAREPAPALCGAADHARELVRPVLRPRRLLLRLLRLSVREQPVQADAQGRAQRRELRRLRQSLAGFTHLKTLVYVQSILPTKR